MTEENYLSCKGNNKKFNSFATHRVEEQSCFAKYSCPLAYSFGEDKLCWQRVNYKSFAKNIENYFEKKEMPEVGLAVARDYINTNKSLKNISETTLLTEPILKKDWNKPEEEKAWKEL